MKKNKLVMAGIVFLVLLLAACSTSSNDEEPNGKTEQPENSPVAESTEYAELYDSALFLGDSITEGLLFHEILNENQVVAGAGKTAQSALETGDVDAVVAQKPKHVYIQLGSTDILWPTEDPISYSISYYTQLIEQIRTQLPEAEMTLLSVTPVTDKAEEVEPRYDRIVAYNERLKSLAAEQQIYYLDLSPLVEEHSELYDEDGIHFQKDFYPILLHYMQEATKGR